jgi:uncharacterized SAM-binding protein YcdF (DUF218 family)
LAFLTIKLAEALASPSTLLLLCSCVGLCLLLARRPGARQRGAIVLLAAPIMVQLVLCVLPLDSWLLAPLEDRFPTLGEAPPTIEGIVCLGGAVDEEITRARGVPSLNEAAERMTAFVALALRHPQARLAFTGGSGRVLHGAVSEADVARRLFDGLGLAGRAIVYEDQSRTTWENAVDLAALVHPKPGQVWVLVTSAAHMPRAMGAFRAAGWTVLADPVGYKTAPTLAAELAPSLPQRLSRIDAAAHEWVGLLAYRLLGRTDRLLPGPAGTAAVRSVLAGDDMLDTLRVASGD